MADGGSPAGVCAQASCHRPRLPRVCHGPCMHSGGSTGLGPLVTPVPRHARPGYGELTWRAHGDVVRGSAEVPKQFHLAHFKMSFL
jgi:hypothetical protein